MAFSFQCVLDPTDKKNNFLLWNNRVRWRVRLQLQPYNKFVSTVSSMQERQISLYHLIQIIKFLISKQSDFSIESLSWRFLRGIGLKAFNVSGFLTEKIASNISSVIKYHLCLSFQRTWKRHQLGNTQTHIALTDYTWSPLAISTTVTFKLQLDLWQIPICG